jgi:hypothetical protein
MSKGRDPGGNKGASMGGMEKSPKRRKRDAAKRRREEEEWAAKSGPVTSYVDRSVVKQLPDDDVPGRP